MVKISRGFNPWLAMVEELGPRILGDKKNQKSNKKKWFLICLQPHSFACVFT